MPKQQAQTIDVELSSSMTGWAVRFDLDAGSWCMCAPTQSIAHPIGPEQLLLIKHEARRVHVQGNIEKQLTQFVDHDVCIKIMLGSALVVIRYISESFVLEEPVVNILTLAYACVAAIHI